jgi:hypothetical protein
MNLSRLIVASTIHHPWTASGSSAERVDVDGVGVDEEEVGLFAGG